MANLSSLKKSDGNPVTAVGDTVYAWEPSNPDVSVDTNNTWARFVLNLPNSQLTFANSVDSTKQGVNFPLIWVVTLPMAQWPATGGVVLSLPDTTVTSSGWAWFLALRYVGTPADTIVFNKGMGVLNDEMHLYVTGSSNTLFMRGGGGGLMYSVTPNQVSHATCDNLCVCLEPKCTCCSSCSMAQK